MTAVKKKVTLVYPGMRVKGNIVQRVASLRIPLGPLFVARPLLDAGYEVDFVDMRLRDFNVEDSKDSVCVGIGAWTGPQIVYGIEVAKRVRERFPDKPIVWGSIHPSIFPEQTLASGYADIVVRNEADVTFPDLVAHLAEGGFSQDSLKGVQGISFLDGNGEYRANPPRNMVDMNDIGLPAYELVNIDDYHNIRDTFDYQSSRGCPYSCAFCYNEMFNGKRWRPKSAEKVVDELMYLHKTYGVRTFAMNDDEFFIKKDRAERVAELLIQRGSPFRWSGFCRFDTFARFSDDALRKLRQSGVDQMFFGAESGNEETLKMVQKKITVDHVRAAIPRTREFNIRPVVSFVLGFPGENERSISDSLALYDEIMRMNPAAEVNGMFLYTPYPGGNLFDVAVANGFAPPKDLGGWGKWDFNYDTRHPWLDKAMTDRLRTVSALARYRFMTAEFFNRTANRPLLRGLFKLLNMPFSLSFHLRWSTPHLPLRLRVAGVGVCREAGIRFVLKNRVNLDSIRQAIRWGVDE